MLGENLGNSADRLSGLVKFVGGGKGGVWGGGPGVVWGGGAAPRTTYENLTGATEEDGRANPITGAKLCCKGRGRY